MHNFKKARNIYIYVCVYIAIYMETYAEEKKCAPGKRNEIKTTKTKNNSDTSYSEDYRGTWRLRMFRRQKKKKEETFRKAKKSGKITHKKKETCEKTNAVQCYKKYWESLCKQRRIK